MTTSQGQVSSGGQDVLAQSNHWDLVTQGVVLRRLGPVAPLRFFTPAEEAVARGLLDRLLGQDDDPRIEILADIDSRLALGVTDGWRYADMPHDGQAWRDTLAFLDEDAQERFGRSFAAVGRERQAACVQHVQDRVGDTWHGLPARQVWSLWTRYACAAYYAHPWAWNEIGFGGPAYPRGYKNLGLDRREPYESVDREARDPVPWAERTQKARRTHLDLLGDQT